MISMIKMTKNLLLASVLMHAVAAPDIHIILESELAVTSMATAASPIEEAESSMPLFNVTGEVDNPEWDEAPWTRALANKNPGEGFYFKVFKTKALIESTALPQQSHRLVHYGPGEYVQPHWHDINELFFIQAGGAHVWLSTDGETWTYRWYTVGDDFTIPGGAYHCLIAGPEGLSMDVRNDTGRSLDWLTKQEDKQRQYPTLTPEDFKVTTQQLFTATQEKLRWTEIDKLASKAFESMYCHERGIPFADDAKPSSVDPMALTRKATLQELSSCLYANVVGNSLVARPFEMGSTLINAADFTAPDISSLCKEAIERYPFGVIFCKTAPADLDTIDYDTDFCYCYFSPGLEKRCALKRIDMCTSTVNAKRDFPDYEAYFRDDQRVMQEYTDGRVFSFCEPWSPSGVIGKIPFIYTRKTAMQSEGKNYMLGCFELIDEQTHKTFFYSASRELPLMSAEPLADAWFQDAFDVLPIGMAIMDGLTVIRSNRLFNRIGAAVNQANMANYGTTGDPLTEYIPKMTPFTTGRVISLLSKTPLSEGKHYDIGSYPIQDFHTSKTYTVIIVYPTMIEAANPYYSAGELVSR